MKYFKKLEGKRIYLSPINTEDYEMYAKWMNDRNVTDGINATNKLITIENEKEWTEKINNNADYNFAIILKDKDILLGNCSISKIDFIAGTAELGIMIGEEEYRSNGYGQETLKLLLDYGFNFLRLHNICLGVFSFNERAINCYKKVGFKEYGRRHEAYYLDGKYYDAILLEYLEYDYKNK